MRTEPHIHSMPEALGRETLVGCVKRTNRFATAGIGAFHAPYFASGRTSILRKKIAAPSDWNWILPSTWLERVPALTT